MNNIEVMCDGPIQVNLSTWSGGEESVRVLGGENGYESFFTHPVEITARIASSSDVMKLLMLADAIRRINSQAYIKLVLPYMPYARQDRVCHRGEALSVRVMANMINLAGFDRIEVWDCHSDVGIAVLDNSVNVHLATLLGNFARENSTLAGILASSTLISPDAGATKKVQVVADRFERPLITAVKTRDSDGVPTIEVLGDMHSTNPVLIIDDICDGGRTFIALASSIRSRGPGEIHLYTTHGIFSHGYGTLFNSGISKIFTANNMRDGEYFTEH